MMSEPIVCFPTCLVDLVGRRLADDVNTVLGAVGFSPIVASGATCCGQPAFNAGHHAQARRVARRTLRRLGDTEGPIVVPSGSCTAMMRRHWVELFHGDRDEILAAAVAKRVREFSEVVDERRRRLSAFEPRLNAVAGYHDSCHMLRELGIIDQPRRLLGYVDGLEVRPLASGERCCGFGGAFSLRYPEVSVAMADDKLADVRESGVDLLVSSDPGCLMQLGSRADRRGDPLRVLHVASVLVEAGVGR